MNKKNKIILKKYLYYVSLIPYIYVLLGLILYPILGYTVTINGAYCANKIGETIYGFAVIERFLVDIMAKYIDFCCSPKVIIVILWVSYQIYYFSTKELNDNKKLKIIHEEKCKNDDNNIQNKTIIKKNWRKIFFYVSVLCWIIYFMIGISSFLFGSNTGGGLFEHARIYGLEGMLSAWFWWGISFSIIPILPVTLIYIIIYIIIYKKKK